MMGGITMARTEVVNNSQYRRFRNSVAVLTHAPSIDLNPEWDQIVYVPVHSLSEVLVLETMDYQHMTKDRTLGYVELPVKSVARQNSSNAQYPHESIEKLTRADPIRLQGNAYKGKLHYVAEFIPAYNLAGLAFQTRGTEMDRAMAGNDESGEDVASGDESSDSDDGFIPEGITIHAQKRPANGATNGSAGNGHSRVKSTDSATVSDNESVKTSGTKRTAKTTGTAATVPSTVPEVSGLEMSREELFKNRL